MKPILQFFALPAILFAFPQVFILAQNNQIVSRAALAEKIYLQLDNKVYSTDRTIWYKIVVTTSADHITTNLSEVLYVELIGPYQTIIEKKIINLQNGIGEGFFDLDNSYPGGKYTVRAYTEWNKNFGNDFIFKEYIHVFHPDGQAKKNPISNVKIIEEQNSQQRLYAVFDPASIDSLHAKELMVILTLDHHKDTFYLRKNNKDDSYQLDYLIPDRHQFAGLQMITQNKFHYSKNIVLDEEYLDLQFFPESGEMIHGFAAKIGFKALDYKGEGKFVEGVIVNATDSAIVARFKSNKLGMGSFLLHNIDSSAKYFARVTLSKAGHTSTCPLPAVSLHGNAMSVSPTEEGIRVITQSTNLKNDSFFIQVSCRGVLFFNIKERMKDGKRQFILPRNELPEGIIAITFLNNQNQPLAERLFFNEKQD